MNHKILIPVLIAFLSAKAFCQVPDKTKLDQYFNALEANNKYMGSVSISKNGKTIYSRSTGFADMETGKKNTAATKFRIGSISKMFTASMVFKAIEENKLKLTDKLDAYYPAIPYADRITIAQLLSHRSGIRNFTSHPLYATWSDRPATEAELIGYITKGGSDFEPDTQADYSNSNYVLLSFILEKTYKMPYKQLLEQKVLKPLKLTNTYYGGKINPAANEANSYEFLDKWNKQTETDMSVPIGAGAIVSTTEDLSRFIEALFAGKVVSQESLAQMKTIKDHYGMGMFEFPYNDKKCYGHSGGIDDFVSFLAYFPDDKVTIAMVSNGANTNTNDISIAMLNWAFGNPFEIPNFKQHPYTEAELNELTGSYINDQMPITFTITTNGKQLSAQASGQSAFLLESKEKNIFTFDMAGITMTFTAERKSFVIEQGGSAFTFTKKEE